MAFPSRRALAKGGKMPCIVSAHSDSTRLVIGQVKAGLRSVYMVESVVCSKSTGKMTSRRLHRTRAGSMPARSQKRRARPMNAPWTPPESPRCAPRPPGLGADRWLLATETLPTHQKFVLHRVSGEKEFLMRWPYGCILRASALPPNRASRARYRSDISRRRVLPPATAECGIAVFLQRL